MSSAEERVVLRGTSFEHCNCVVAFYSGIHIGESAGLFVFPRAGGRMAWTMEKFDVVILGGGAAGLMCAVEAGGRGRRVAVIERAERVGKKILISGGGRCNFTNLHCRPENFISANPHFAKSALARYTPSDFIALVEKHRIPYHE